MQVEVWAAVQVPGEDGYRRCRQGLIPPTPQGLNPQVRYTLSHQSHPGANQSQQLFQVMPNGLLVAQADQLRPGQSYHLQVGVEGRGRPGHRGHGGLGRRRGPGGYRSLGGRGHGVGTGGLEIVGTRGAPERGHGGGTTERTLGLGGSSMSPCVSPRCHSHVPSWPLSSPCPPCPLHAAPAVQVLARDEESGETSNTTVELEVLWPGQAGTEEGDPPRNPPETPPSASSSPRHRPRNRPRTLLPQALGTPRDAPAPR